MALRAEPEREGKSVPDRESDPYSHLEHFESSGQRLVCFAAERTLLSWIRTGLSLMALSFVVDRLGFILFQMQIQQEATVSFERFSFWVGTGLVLPGSIMNFFAGVRYHRISRRFGDAVHLNIEYGLQVGILMTFLIGIIGLIIAAYLVQAAVLPR